MGIDLTGIGAVADAAKDIANKFFPDKTEIEKAQIALEMQDRMNAYKLSSAQTDINLEEAKSTNWFVAGWRPAIGWTCAAGLAYQFLFMPIFNGLLNGLLLLAGHQALTVPLFIELDISTLMTCVGGLLGLGTLRTVEKVKSVARG